MQYKLDKKHKEFNEYIAKNYSEEHTKYLEKNLVYKREPFIGSWYESKIIIRDLFKGYPSIFDFERYDYSKQVFEEIDTILPLNKRVEEYNAHVTVLQNKIKSNYLHESILNYLSDKTDYELSCIIDKYQRGVDLDDFKIIINLKYKNRKIKGCNFNRKFQVNSKIDDFFEEAFSKIKIYFEKLEVLNSITELKSITNKLKNVFQEFNIDIKGEDYYENVFKIEGINDYYVFNDCISLDVDRKEVIINISDLQEVFNYISNDINEELMNDTKRHCYECGDDFVLELGEIKFFIKKGFDYPRRCKPCRKVRRQSK
jgi:hypothetical protein